MSFYIMMIKPHSNSSQYVERSKIKGFVYDVNNTEVFDEKYIEWFKNSSYYDEKNTTIIPIKTSVIWQ